MTPLNTANGSKKTQTDMNRFQLASNHLRLAQLGILIRCSMSIWTAPTLLSRCFLVIHWLSQVIVDV